MWRYAGAGLMVAALGSGCMSGGGPSGPNMMAGPPPSYGAHRAPPSVPGVVGPYGEKVPMAAPYNAAPPGSAWAARQMMGQSIPLDLVQMHNPGAMAMGGPGGGLLPNTKFPGGGPMLAPPGLPFAPGAPGGSPVMQAKFNPGGPSGIINANIPPGMMPPGGVIPAQAMAGPMANLSAMGLAAPGPGGMTFNAQRTQVRFSRPTGMKISWFTRGPDNKPMFSETPIESPGRYNFLQAAVYRLKLSNIEGRPGLEIYPTMEVVPANAKTEAFLAHSAVPVEFTPEDFKQIADGNYVIKVIYLPDPQFQDVAGTGTDEILSTRLEPGADPIQEAMRRGSILLVIRMGNVDQEAPNTPPLNTPGAAPPMMPPGLPPMPGSGFPIPQVPFIPGAPGGPNGVMAPRMPNMPPGMMPPAAMPNFPGAPNLTGPGPQPQRPVAPSSPAPGVTGPAPAPGSLNLPSVPLTGPTTPAPQLKVEAPTPMGTINPVVPGTAPLPEGPAAPALSTPPPLPGAPTPITPPALPSAGPGLPSNPPPLPGPGPSKLLELTPEPGPGVNPPPLPNPAFPPTPGSSNQPTPRPDTTSSGNGSLGLTPQRVPTAADLAIQTPAAKGR